MVKYEKPVGNVLSQFQQLAILPKHIWAGYTGHKGADLKTFPNAAPIVSGGTFILTKFKKDEIALFERNPTFYGPKPHIKGFGLRMFSNDDALVSAMKSGEIDAIESVPPTGDRHAEEGRRDRVHRPRRDDERLHLQREHEEDRTTESFST